MKARRCPATTGNFLRAVISQPFSTHGVTAGIHWEALKLWRKGAGYRRRPVYSARHSSSARPLTSSRQPEC
ncbi:MAG: DUF1365 family protein [Pseudomonadota bacterium]